MSLRSKLGLTLTGLALGSVLACGPKPVRVTGEDLLGRYQTHNQQIIDGQLPNKGHVKIVRQTIIYESGLTFEVVGLEYHVPNSDSLYHFTDAGYSRHMFDSAVDIVAVFPNSNDDGKTFQATQELDLLDIQSDSTLGPLNGLYEWLLDESNKVSKY